MAASFRSLLRKLAPASADERQRRQIVAANPACATAPNGTAERCCCDHACANYWLRVAGFRPAEGPGRDQMSTRERTDPK